MALHLKPKQVEEIKLSSLGLGIGENTRITKCPECGVSGDFSITRYDLGLFYVCYRASCGVRGFISSASGAVNKPKKEKKSKLFKYETTNLKEEHYNFFLHNYTLLSKVINLHGVSWCPTLQRLIFPCFTKEGYIWGYNARYYKKLDHTALKVHGKETKSILYQENTDTCTVSWSRGVVTHPIILVEDQTSAMKLSQDVSAIALLGHEIPDTLWEQIRDREVIVALDADVSHKVGRILSANALKVQALRAITLEMDIKDMPHHKYRLFLDKVFKT
jgi:hypothetical protein